MAEMPPRNAEMAPKRGNNDPPKMAEMDPKMGGIYPQKMVEMAPKRDQNGPKRGRNPKWEE